jgi:hypothetical protein
VSLIAQDDSITDTTPNLDAFIALVGNSPDTGLSPLTNTFYKDGFASTNGRLSCIPNEIVATPDQCSLSPVLQTSDSKTEGQSSSYCLTLKDASFTDIDGRYSGATCLDGTPPLATVVADIEAKFTKSKASWDELQILAGQIGAKATEIKTKVGDADAAHKAYPAGTGFSAAKSTLKTREIIPTHPHKDITHGNEFKDLTECGKITETLGKDIIGNFCFEYIYHFGE